MIAAAAIERSPLVNPAPSPIAVIAAMREEIEPLVRRLAGRVSVGSDLVAGRLAGRELVLSVCGEGSARAASGIERLFVRCSPSRIVGIGIAGGLTPTLSPGSIVVATRVATTTGVLDAPADDWRRIAVTVSGGVEAAIATSDVILTTREAKTRLARRLAEHNPLVVDLESAAWARAAQAHRVPWLILRAVSDTMNEDLPFDFDRLRDATGSVDRRRVLWHAVARPTTIPALWRLRARVRLAAARLADLIEEIVAAVPDEEAQR